MIALHKSIEKFDHKMESNFSFYALRTITFDLRYYVGLREVDIPNKWTERRSRISKAFYKKANSGANLYDENVIREIAQENSDFPIEEIRLVLNFILKPKHARLDQPITSNENPVTMLDFIPDPNIDIEKKVLEQVDMQRLKNQILESIKRKKKPVYYKVIVTDNLFSEDPRSLVDIAQQFNISRQAVFIAKEYILNLIKENTGLSNFLLTV